MVPNVTGRLVNVTGDVTRDIPTTIAANVSEKSSTCIIETKHCIVNKCYQCGFNDICMDNLYEQVQFVHVKTN